MQLKTTDVFTIGLVLFEVKCISAGLSTKQLRIKNNEMRLTFEEEPTE